MSMSADPSRAVSYYATTAHAHKVCPTLAGDVSCDVAVVGGGITGLSAALHLRARGYAVVLLEGAELGAGASGRSGGQVLPGYACGLSTLAKHLARAKQLGLSNGDTAGHLSELLPQLVDKLTPHGHVPEGGVTAESLPGLGGLGDLLGKFMK